LLELIKGANLALRFLLELYALRALGYLGFKTGGGAVAKITLSNRRPARGRGSVGAFLSPGRPARCRGRWYWYFRR
jgi:Protein of unknown function (DUF2568)